MEEKNRSRTAAVIVLCVAIAVIIALVTWMIFATTPNRPVDTLNATQTSLAKTGGSVTMDGIEGELLSGAIISMVDEAGNKVIEKLELKDGSDLPAVNAGTYELTLDAPPVGEGGMIYECLDPIREVIVGDDGSYNLDFDFRIIPTDQMTPDQLQRVKDELEAVGAPQEVISAITETYTPQQPAQVGEQPTHTETWTYVETPQQQPQVQQQPLQTQPQGHVHNWVTTTETVKTEPTYGYYPVWKCDDCNTHWQSDYWYDYENPHPPDEYQFPAIWSQHKAQTGHSGYHMIFTSFYKTLGGTQTITKTVCTECGATQ